MRVCSLTYFQLSNVYVYVKINKIESRSETRSKRQSIFTLTASFPRGIVVEIDAHSVTIRAQSGLSSKTLPFFQVFNQPADAFFIRYPFFLFALLHFSQTFIEFGISGDQICLQLETFLLVLLGLEEVKLFALLVLSHLLLQKLNFL